MPTIIVQQGQSSGPRVKHVSRSVNMAQGAPAVKHPAAAVRLSALPAEEKCKIWNEELSLSKSYSDEDIEKSKTTKHDYDWFVLLEVKNLPCFLCLRLGVICVHFPIIFTCDLPSRVLWLRLLAGFLFLGET